MNGVLRFVLGLSLAGGATCLAVFAASLPFKNRVKKSWLYSVWLIVLLRFIIPAPLNLPFVSNGINAVVSFMTATEPAQRITSVDTITPAGGPASSSADPAPQEVLSNNSTAAGDAVSAPHDDTATTEKSAGQPLPAPGPGNAGVALAGSKLLTLLPYAWLIGASALLLWTVAGYALTVVKLRCGRTLLTPGRVPVYETGQLTTPILAGILRPAIYLPTSFPNRELAVLHERTHLRRGDLWLKWLAQLTVCVHWFNPLAWLMKRELNRLTELACDSAVLRRLEPSERAGYGRMLLDTANAASGRSSMLVASLGKDKSFLTERITEVVKARKTTRKTIAAMTTLAVLILSAAVVFGALFSGCTSPSANRTASPVTSVDQVGSTPAAGSITPASSESPKLAIPSGTAPGFVNDPDLVGTWIAFAYTQSVPDFTPSGSNGIFFGNAFVAYENGWTNKPYRTWSKGILSYYDNQLTANYTIRDIDGSRYLFVKALSKNQYYFGTSYEYAVYKWDSDPIQTTYYSDDIDLPFVDDPAILGTWKTAVGVESIADFNPDNLDPTGNEITFLEGGAVKDPTPEGLARTGLSWTKGYIVNAYNVTASAYEIKIINGISYMFVEGKNDYYTRNHQIQAYAVWQKITGEASTSTPSP